MISLRLLAGVTAAAMLMSLAPAFADESPSMTNESVGAMSGARFGGSVYGNNPKLTNTLSLVIAGGGPKHFSTVTLFKVLAGDKMEAEVAALTKEYGAAKFGQFVKTFDFVINDSLAIVTKAKVALPAKPDPDPTDGKALAAALYTDGMDSKTGGFNVEYMLDHLVTHPVHVQVMKDIDKKFGAQADADYHIILTKVMGDLKSVYGL
jgi:hypothetical protein